MEGRRVYWEVLHRLLEEQLAENLLAVLGHLVLLRFTGRQTREEVCLEMFNTTIVGVTMHTL